MTYGFIFSDPSELQHKATVMRSFAFLVPLVYSTNNTPSHSVPNLSNVEIHFLPPTTTSHLQPLDAGIIQCFKGHYRRQHLRHLVDCIDNDAPPLCH
jgi:hypothetical protein